MLFVCVTGGPPSAGVRTAVQTESSFTGELTQEMAGRIWSAFNVAAGP
jgi:hypothetical protein